MGLLLGKSMRCVRFFPLFVIACIASFNNSASARNLALLVGVSNYELSGISKLKAPGNDVRLVYDTLRDRSFGRDDIIVLADALERVGEEPMVVGKPTAKAIFDALDFLAANVVPDDLVVVYFSGHGSYVRQDRKAGEIVEPTGFNQVLLAIDAGQRDDVRAEIKGAITDKALKLKFDAIRRKSFLWVILDACHSGGMTRDETVRVAVHFVDPKVLDRTVRLREVSPLAGEQRVNRWISAEVGGKQVAFLAAPETYPSYEKEIGENGKSYSLFTYTVMNALRAENFSSYRQLARAVRLKQASSTGNVPPPVFEGDLDNPLFDGLSEGPRNWSAQLDAQSGEVLVAAGSLNGIYEGATMELSRNGKFIGNGEVISARAAQSRVRMRADGKDPAPGAADLSGDLIANVSHPVVPFLLRVARPLPSSTNKLAERVGHAAIEALTREARSELPIEWLAPGTRDADFHLRVEDEVIYLVPSTGELVRNGRARTPSIAIDTTDETKRRLQENLWRALRQRNLLRIAGQMRDSPFARAVDLSISLLRDVNEFARVRANEGQKCTTWNEPDDAASRTKLVIDGTRPIWLTHCDQVLLEITNRWKRDIDVTVLYMDAEAGIGRLLSGGEVRIAAGEAHRPHKFAPLGILTWCDATQWSLCQNRARIYQPTGNERLMVIIAEVATKEEARTFQYLAQPSFDNARQYAAAPRAHVRGDGDAFDDLMREAALALASPRGEVNPAGDATIKVISWTVLPPDRFKP